MFDFLICSDLWLFFPTFPKLRNIVYQLVNCLKVYLDSCHMKLLMMTWLECHVFVELFFPASQS
jgi:hypothetical protein